jgi:predicted acylesterase/phospholipase RssA
VSAGPAAAGQATPPDPDPLDRATQPPLDRYCDLVLTGGVIDGVVYPWAVHELARRYRFRSIGGTSVGAMAAAIVAAAEYRRRLGSLDGFNEVLLKLPRELSKDVAGKTRLSSLFQPGPKTQRLFDLFVSFFGAEGLSLGSEAASSYTKAARGKARDDDIRRKRLERVRNALGLARTLLGIYRCPGLMGGGIGIVGLLLGVWLGLDALLTLSAWRMAIVILSVVFLLALPAMLLFGAILVGIAVYRDLVHGVVPNGFGLCNGYRVAQAPTRRPTLIGRLFRWCTGDRAEEPQPNPPSLVEWLYEGIQGAAGKPLGEPLTFRDLWDAPGGPAPRLTPLGRRTRKTRSIDLRMVTTNLTHGRPYGMPPDDRTSRLFFKVKDLRPYFPEPVIRHLVAHSKRYAPAGSGDPKPARRYRKLRELPSGELPVVVAARLSLSFPLLFSTVPLWAIDYEPKRRKRTLRRCRFSDGGICSNFPIHLFDAVVPEWPTFGINLGPRSVFRNEQFVWMPQRHTQGRGDSWFRFGDERSVITGEPISPLDRLVGFVLGIVYSAKDWNDKVSMRMPGVRDRTVHVALAPGEGGLKLNMPGPKIMEFAADYGEPAGKAIVDRYLDPAAGGRPSSAWDEQRWVRFNTWLVGLRERIENLKDATEFPGYGKVLSIQIHDAKIKRPLAGTDPAGAPLSGHQADDLEKLLAALKELEAKLAQARKPQPYEPVPPPNLAVRSPL